MQVLHGGVDDGIRHRQIGQGLGQILLDQGDAVDGGRALGAVLADDLMTGRSQIDNQPGAHETRRAGNQNPHKTHPFTDPLRQFKAASGQ